MCYATFVELSTLESKYFKAISGSTPFQILRSEILYFKAISTYHAITVHHFRLPNIQKRLFFN